MLKLKKLLIKSFSFPRSVVKQIISFKVLSVDYAQFKTMRNWECLDINNDAIPWYTYPAIEYLNNLNFSQKSIFEYGSGNSSLYWSKKSKKTTSIEDSQDWFEKIKFNLNKNQALFLKKSNSDYENAIIEEGEKFDVIIIDGIRRVECSRVIREHLNIKSEEGCMVILDNSDWYKNTAKYLREQLGLIEIDFHGFGPIGRSTSTTSIFLSRNFNFKPINNTQPNFSVAAIRVQHD
jgi:hypothetical protein